MITFEHDSHRFKEAARIKCWSKTNTTISFTGNQDQEIQQRFLLLKKQKKII